MVGDGFRFVSVPKVQANVRPISNKVPMAGPRGDGGKMEELNSQVCYFLITFVCIIYALKLLSI
jgi:hypothetical protein